MSNVDKAELEPGVGNPALTNEQTEVSAELPFKVTEVGAQIGRITSAIVEAGLPRKDYIERFWPREGKDGSKTLILQQDQYPGVGAIRPVTSASVTRTNNEEWNYFRSTETSHSGSGARSFEQIAVSPDDISISVFNHEGFRQGPYPQALNYSWQNPDDRPFIEDALSRLGSKLDAWHQTALDQLSGEDTFPAQFRYNILSYERKQ